MAPLLRCRVVSNDPLCSYATIYQATNYLTVLNASCYVHLEHTIFSFAICMLLVLVNLELML